MVRFQHTDTYSLRLYYMVYQNCQYSTYATDIVIIVVTIMMYTQILILLNIISQNRFFDEFRVSRAQLRGSSVRGSGRFERVY